MMQEKRNSGGELETENMYITNKSKHLVPYSPSTSKLLTVL